MEYAFGNRKTYSLDRGKGTRPRWRMVALENGWRSPAQMGAHDFAMVEEFICSMVLWKLFTTEWWIFRVSVSGGHDLFGRNSDTPTVAQLQAAMPMDRKLPGRENCACEERAGVTCSPHSFVRSRYAVKSGIPPRFPFSALVE
ncbi:hypothetical protein ACFYNY_21415 [Streptomyces sp. NPDC006530]|uniref:hypothetical protein n=1 Tax=Streptomyces sp. NPDC006530 TaxID=3364750 RepID=UPI0036786537